VLPNSGQKYNSEYKHPHLAHNTFDFCGVKTLNKPYAAILGTVAA
jgi:hypothetical protein